MAVWFRHADRRVPPLWGSDIQPAARWHGTEDGPAQYLSDTPDGAWAEFLRHEEITDPADLRGIERSLWALEVDEAAETIATPDLPTKVLVGGKASYHRCQDEARRLREGGASALRAQTAALQLGEARGEVIVDGKLEPGPDRDGETLVLFGERPTLVAWRCVEVGAPSARLLNLVRQL
jgi:hypothetical protein